MKYLVSLILIMSLLIGGAAVYSSDISQADFFGVITTSNNSTLATNVSSNISNSIGLTANLISGGFLNSGATNLAIQNSSSADIAFMPGYNTNPWIIWAGDMASNSISDSILYVKNVTGGKLAYFPGPTGMSVADNDTLEPGNNTRIDILGYLDTSAGENKIIASHYDATNGGVKIFVSPTVSQNVTARITANPFSSTANITPNAEGTVTNLVPSAGANYQCVDDPPSTPDDAATYVYHDASAYVWDSYNLTTPTFLGTPESVVINSVTVRFRIWNAGGSGYEKCNLSLGSANTTGTQRATTTTWTTWSENLTRPGGGDWTVSDFNNLQAGIGINAVSGYNDCTQIYVQINYSAETRASLTVSGIPSGEYLTRFQADGTNMWLSVGSSNSANVSVVSIPNSSANWTFCSANTTPYMLSASINVPAGTPVSAWDWEYGATFHDSIGGNDATPTFRTTSSDPDVISVLSSFSPTSQPKAPAFVVGEGPPFLSTTISATANFTTGNVTKSYPGKSIIDAVAAAGGVPYQIPSTYIAMFFLLILSMGTSYFLKQQAAASLFVKSVVNIAGYGVLVALGIFDWWMLIFYFLFEPAIWSGAKERRE